MRIPRNSRARKASIVQSADVTISGYKLNQQQAMLSAVRRLAHYFANEAIRAERRNEIVVAFSAGIRVQPPFVYDSGVFGMVGLLSLPD